MPRIKFKKLFTFSNLISFVRLLLIFPTIYLLSDIKGHDVYRYYVLGLFFLAYLTDILDGYLARKFDEISELGKIIDPLADKIFVIAVVFQLYLYDTITSLYFWVIVLRDIIIFLGGIYVSKRIGKVLPSNLLGKITVASIGIFLIAVVAGAEQIPWIYYSTQYLSLGLSIASIIGYAIRGYESIRWYEKNGST